ncbi:hypothetical protein B2I21_08765 [Chryseobacterium mucoviscidosis]|nr:hypothetical protein B2I21_08765 [Chryseobacterium mucoviscidosis]
MSRTFIAAEKIRHNGVNYPIGSEVLDLTDKDRDRLIRLKSGKWVDAAKELQEVVAQDASPVGYADLKTDNEVQVQSEPQVDPQVITHDERPQDEPVPDSERLEKAEELDLSLTSDTEVEKPVAKGKAGRK